MHGLEHDQRPQRPNCVLWAGNSEKLEKFYIVGDKRKRKKKTIKKIMLKNVKLVPMVVTIVRGFGCP